MKTLGVIILIAGLLLTIFTAGKFFTTEKVVDLGKVEISKQKPHYISWSPLVGIVIMGIGGAVLWSASKK
jgi:hypothetical protein